MRQFLRSRVLWGLGVAGVALGLMTCLAVLAFHFPAYLTTPLLRDIYSEQQVRLLLTLGLWAGCILSILALLFGPERRLPCLGLLLSATAFAMGGADVPITTPVTRESPYLSVDWVLLDLLLLSVIFIPIERLFKLRPEQAINRPGWKTDLTYYVFNHVFMGALVVIIHLPANALMRNLDASHLQQTVAGLPLIVQFVLIACIGEFSQYWVHRLHHEIPWLWRFHRVHHSSKAMDWLAGSRLHIVDVLLTRSLTLTPILILGFSPQAINLWLPVLAIQSVFIHSNVRWKLLSLRLFVSTPLYHHWHHADEPEAINKNYAVSLPFMDKLFGTYHCPDRWPRGYGVPGDLLPEGFWNQLLGRQIDVGEKLRSTTSGD